MNETTGGKAFWGDAASAYAQGITDGAAVERELIRQRAEAAKFTLYRPGNGPGAGHQQALEVVPLAALMDQP